MKFSYLTASTAARTAGVASLLICRFWFSEYSFPCTKGLRCIGITSRIKQGKGRKNRKERDLISHAEPNFEPTYRYCLSVKETFLPYILQSYNYCLSKDYSVGIPLLQNSICWKNKRYL